MEPLMNYYCKGSPNNEELESACRIAELGKKPVCLMFEFPENKIQFLVIHPEDEIADVQLKLKHNLFQESYC